ncbi:helix-turn-helix domain-containing protein [Amycolatopsis jiangsuensis]|uniref:Excisionase family DNA binding protein n=1 Tax=Amycolatopsis jiangsuensis TaxID=1181879 RepID=A0A840IUW4_9PSEU|nr:helix-turn-helix domain-containing protein [Amycolatopsis jiangsuensis]MBB4684764.1 excisionase family DNA binding protein [Amycolatopsis jiangsuensis]
MSEHNSHAVSTGVFSIQEVAWILGVSKSEVCRLIRVGTLPAVRRHSRLVVPAHAVARLLPAPGERGQA